MYPENCRKATCCGDRTDARKTPRRTAAKRQVVAHGVKKCRAMRRNVNKKQENADD